MHFCYFLLCRRCRFSEKCPPYLSIKPMAVKCFWARNRCKLKSSRPSLPKWTSWSRTAMNSWVIQFLNFFFSFKKYSRLFRLNNQFRNNSKPSSKALNYPLLAQNPFKKTASPLFGLIFKMLLYSSFCNQQRRPIISQKIKSEKKQFKSLLSL